MARPEERKAFVRFQVSTETGRNRLNEPTYTWALYREAWVKLDQRRGSERGENTTLTESESTHRLYGDFYDLAGVNTKMRLAYDAEGLYTDPLKIAYFDIVAVMEDFTNRIETWMDVRQVERMESASDG